MTAQLAARVEALDAHFARVYAGRWEALRRALAEPTRHIAWVNPFASRHHEEAASALAKAAGEGWEVLRHEHCTMVMHRRAQAGRLPSPSRPVGAAVLGHYAVDGASALPALAVAPAPGDCVLDFCAAPGGKTLFLAGQLAIGGGVLVANEKASSRRSRLRHVLDNYVPGPVLHLRELAGARRLAETADALHVAIADFDATDQRVLRTLPFSFDKILVDAPCSSERHFVHGNTDQPWSTARIKRNAKLQLAILRCAFVGLKPGGRLVYSTCSIADDENDDVVRNLLAKTKKSLRRSIRVDDPFNSLPALLLEGAERTQFGAILLPDRTGFGPLYWSVLIADGDESSSELELPGAVPMATSDIVKNTEVPF